jgi:hypothetical protein
VVLILILAMLGLLALIGVAFATFSSQAQVGGRKYAEAASWPTSEDVMDFALSQIINDTHNPQSAIRFHSLKRDMYGSDATGNGILTALPGGGNLLLTSTGTVNSVQTSPTFGYTQYATNIPAGGGPGLYGLNFTRWTLKLAATTVGFDANANPISPTVPPMITTYEVLADTVQNGFHNLTLSNPDTTTSLYNPMTGGSLPLAGQLITPQVAAQNGIPFALDGRYLRAFNGPGLTQYFNINGQLINQAAFGNFTLNNNLLNYDPTKSLTYTPTFNARTYQMDEDYDAPDLDNWFLGLQSADGTVVIPSFHRPGIVADQDWLLSPWRNPLTGQPFPQGIPPTDTTNYPNLLQGLVAASKVLRPRAIDGHDAATFPNLIPDPNTGQITYDVDNNGDGVTDSVWLDLGYPVQRDANGKMFKPLFAISILGLNGRMPLNTAGNLQGVLDSDLFDTNAAFQGNTPTVYAYAGSPTYSHASHIGYSANEINPLYALQNANDPTASLTGQPLFTQVDNFPVPANNAVSINNGGTTQTATPGVAVNLTQLRNILAGTRPQSSLTGYNPFQSANDDANSVMVNGQAWYLPNNVLDPFDNNQSNGTYVARLTDPVAGRWGEERFVPNAVPLNPYGGAQIPPYPSLFAFNNFIRAGRSNALPLPPGLRDGTDDDFDSTDYGATVVVSTGYLPTGAPESGDVYEFNYLNSPASNYNTGAGLFPVERIRRFVKPIDPSGNGRLMGWNQQPTYMTIRAGQTTPGNPWGTGSDRWGRVGHFDYFRPPGLPPTIGSTNGYNFAQSYANNNTGLTAYAPWAKGPLNFGLPVAGAPTIPAAPDPRMTNNPTHGFDAERVPVGANTVYDPINNPPAATIPPSPPIFNPFAAMPYNPTANGLSNNAIPTFASPINSTDYWAAVAAGSTSTLVVNGYPGGSFNHDEADEMNLYRPGHYDQPMEDAPFGPHDLEWLYRKQDVDGASLNSRLAQLAPISFLNPVDGSTRRNLFSVDTWDLTNFAFAVDNPGTSVFRFNDRGPSPRNGGAGIDGFSYLQTYANGILYNPNLGPPTGPLQVVPTPNIAHRDRKPNLNFPLPVSNSPVEPVRQKWIRETYQFLKAILPPEATDTPQELAQISQFVVNIVDFRDPDGTPTRFVNTDLVNYLPTKTTPAYLNFTALTLGRTLPNNGAYDVTYDPNADPALGPTVPPFLVQYGMEYSPVAINEVLAYSFISGLSGTGNNSLPISSKRLYVELVNTLTDGANNPITYNNYLVQPNVSDVDLTGWDIVLFPGDDYLCRPDPITGEMPPVGGQTNPPAFVPLRGPAFDSTINTTLTPDPTMPDHPVLALRSSGGATSDQKATANQANGNADLSYNRYYYLLGNPAPTQGANSPSVEVNAPTTPLPPNNFNFTAMVNTDVDQVMIANPNGGTATDPNDNTVQAPPFNNVSGTTQDPMNNFPTLTAPAQNANNGLQSDPTYTPTGIPKTPSMYCWAYLRRPINPLDPTSPKVVVDSFRFTYVEGGGRVKKQNQPTGGTQWVFDAAPPDGTQEAYIASTERQQPYSGGHAVPYGGQAGNNGLALTPQSTRFPYYGYSEQTSPSQPVSASIGGGPAAYYPATYPYPLSQITVNPQNYYQYAQFNPGNNQNPFPITNPLYHSLRERNTVAERWDLYPHHDRDFQSVAELLLVPGCPPGLFTKLFTEFAPPIANPIVPTGTGTGAVYTNPILNVAPQQQPNPQTNPQGPQQKTWPVMSAYYYGNFGLPHTYPYLPDNFYYYPYGATLDNVASPIGYGGPVVGGPSGTGWHKMLGFFEVPSSANGAIGPVGLGSNTDWYRQDTRPGQLNLNLIIDEEVFFGLLDDPRLNLTPVANVKDFPGGPPPISGLQNPTTLPTTNPTAGGTPTTYPPAIVTGYDSVNGVYHGFWMNAARGFTYWRDPVTSQVKLFPTLGTDVPSTTPPTLPPNGPPPWTTPGAGIPGSGIGMMKQSFSDFIKYIHGGSGFLFAFGNGPIGSSVFPLAAHARPFHDLTFPDIDSTVMRPAFQTSGLVNNVNVRTSPAANPRDPGLKFVLNIPPLSATYDPWSLSPPPIPIRRLFQVPDASGTTNGNNAGENASLLGDTTTTSYNNVSAFNAVDLAQVNGSAALGTLNSDPTLPLTALLGPFPGDRREHPAFRTEWLQKVMNLTTVRTHQYACWITVGFFEVRQPGDPQHIDATTGVLAPLPDILGAEVGALEGKNVRYRNFFIIDRTKATGFNPTRPGNFDDLIVYRRRIE